VRGAQPSLYRVASQRLADFPRTIAAYRFKEITRYVATDAKTVELTLQEPGSAALSQKIEHGDAGWQGAPESVDPGKAARLVAELARLRGVDIVSESPTEGELAKLGLAPPRARIRVLAGAAGSVAPAVLGVVDVGADLDGKGPVARSPASATVYRLAPTVVEWLPTGLTSFRNSFAAKPDDGAKAGASPAADAAEEPGEDPDPAGLSDE
jgi:hypothetical protein